MHTMHAAQMRGASQYKAPMLFGVQTANVASAASIAVTAPAGVRDGDLLIAVAAASSVRASWALTGFTELLDDGTNNLYVAYKIAASEGASFTFTPASSSSMSAIVAAFRLADYDAASSVSALSGATVVMPSVTASGPLPLMVSAACLAGSGGTTSITDLGGMSLVSEVNVSARPWIALYMQAIAPGASGTRSLTATGGLSGAALSIALKRD